MQVTFVPPCQSCGAPATHVTSWRTDIMQAPAFWYDCTEHLARTKESLAINPHVIAETRAIEGGGMTPVTPLVQPPVEDLRNGLMIADAWASPELSDAETAVAFESVSRLIRAALEKLAEPHPVTVKVVAGLLRAMDVRDPGEQFRVREARDVAAVITRTALTWEAPK